MKKIIIIATFTLFIQPTIAQELLCRVNVNYQQTNTTNTQVFMDMQKDISNFMNNTRWTNYVFANNERIECSILINITGYDGVENFVATLQVSSSRPVFDASITTPILKLKEKSEFKFKYVSNQPLQFNPNTYTDELSSTLAFYAYVIIGMDFDTFSELGGTEFFEKAQKIVANAQSSQYKAWKPMGTSHEDNRYYLVKNLTSPVFKPFRQALYKYHRLGLDLMTTDITTGRNNILQALELIKQSYQKKPNNYLVNIFVEAKRREIKNIFSEAPPQEITKVKQIMQFIDPANSDKYNDLGKH